MKKKTRLRGPHPIFSRPKNCSSACKEKRITGGILNRLGGSRVLRFGYKRKQAAEGKEGGENIFFGLLITPQIQRILLFSSASFSLIKIQLKLPVRPHSVPKGTIP
ncbi:hypothetical protein LR48_Vigan05g068600 [Vigna angularis]|uniref:Uncharacterized protein n=1 Tax=Phaseolus angularis TaxID=3914 RepID=A0A0L9UKJ7_PHAAN|nr:hypothetical protein LR48_Vigan05g068600 [Vigna angularis]